MPGGFGSQTLDRLIAHWSPQSPSGDWSTPACMYQIISHSSRDTLQSAPEACQASIIQSKHIYYIPYPHLYTHSSQETSQNRQTEKNNEPHYPHPTKGLQNNHTLSTIIMNKHIKLHIKQRKIEFWQRGFIANKNTCKCK